MLIKKMVKRLLKNGQKPAITENDIIYNRFRDFTMIEKRDYKINLDISRTVLPVAGDIVECGVWKGGMMGGMATILGNQRQYYLFDSFEGLPLVEEIDGKDAANWQQDTTSDYYYDNCTAEMQFAVDAMKIAFPEHQDHVHIIKGWFEDTITKQAFPNGIALLRLDSDWYKSTMFCLDSLFAKVVKGGIIIIDDYYSWDGCSRALHDYLSKHQLPNRIFQADNRVAYLKII